ncbi:MAG: O-antigen ligase family protein [Patescibacteria group bacterium]|nr:O-antigen ligase family protein [Patescibacteria group bacterium]
MFEDFILDLGGEVHREVHGEERGRMIWFWLSLIFLVAAFVVLGYPLTLLGVLVIAALALVFIKYHRFGLYILIFLSPFIGLVVKLPTGDLGVASEFFAGSLDFPLVDGIAMILFAAWLMKSLYLWKVKKFDRWQIYFPGIMFFGAFIFVALASVSMAGESWMQSLKYCIRPIMFFYLMYLVLPYNLIRSREIFQRCLQFFYSAGIISAMIGFVSLFILPATGLLRRATPIGFFGVSPLGENHNLLAEILVAAFPIGMILFRQAKDKWTSLGLILGNILILIIALLTFARTAWIAIALEILIYLVLVYRKELQRYLKYIFVPILLVLPFMIYMYVFSTSYVAQSSTQTRLMLSEIALNLLQSSPILGHGAGMFVENVANTYLFTLEFGQAMDAHGVLQKVGAEMGIAGLLALAFMFGFIIVRLLRSYLLLPATSQGRYIVISCLVMAAGSMTYQLFNTNYYSPKLWIPLALALAATKVFRHEERPHLEKKKRKEEKTK